MGDWRRQIHLTLAVLPSVWGCAEKVKKPPPPDMVGLISTYDAPTGELTAATIGAVQSELEDRLLTLADFCGWQAGAVEDLCAELGDCNFCQGLDPLADTFRALGKDTDGSEDLGDALDSLDGFMRIRRFCAGDGSGPPRNPENGYLQAVVGFTDGEIDQVFGAELVECKFELEGSAATVNADFSVAFTRRFLPRELLDPELEPIVRVRASVESQNGTTDFNVNLRLAALGRGNISVAFEVPDVGSMVFFSGRSGFGIQAANGNFSCDLDKTEPEEPQLRCVNIATGEKVP